jgi:Transglutaminase-like superfamily
MAAPPADLRPTTAARTLPPHSLSHRERGRLACQIVIAYARSRRALRRAPIESVVEELRAQAPPASEQAQERTLEEAVRLGWMVTRTLRFMPGDTRCLARSLTLTKLLAGRGIHAKLVIGARAEPDFLAHAWVEYGGEAILSPGDGSFGRLVEL